MTSLINIDQEFAKYKNKRFNAVLLYICIAISLLLAIFLVFYFSTSSYAWNLIVDIILGIILFVSSVYFFSIIFSDYNNKANYFEKVKSGIKETYLVTFHSNIDEEIKQDKLIFNGVELTVHEGIKETNRVFIEYEEKFEFKENTQYEIECCGRLILSVVTKK